VRTCLRAFSGCVGILLSFIFSPGAATADPGWRLYADSTLGYSLVYPAALFDGAPVQEHGGITLTSSGGARLYIFGGQNPGLRSSEAVARHLSGADEIYEVTYRRLAQSWLVLSGYLAGSGQRSPAEIFYERIAFAPDRNFLAGFRLVYPPAQRALFDPIIRTMGRSLKPPGSERTASIAPPAATNGGLSVGHEAWCRHNYATYDAATDSFLRFDGTRVPCVGPAQQ
jgi:hypothetical protein